ncbi:GPW/gp25 family protein [Emcibacter sp.]|uniref:GPW/gp25 family protein n=1 Tax=Emcibacter sp. TaxID=1979954 RepID=UPI002AA7A086|nr:GPW/gp25 family protein [Emcibacter sp.]
MGTGMHRETGEALTGVDLVRQNIIDVLTTPKGTRRRLRGYGSRLFSLVDAPLNTDTILEINVAVAEALDAWVPDFALDQVKVLSSEQGKAELELTGSYLVDGSKVTLEGIVV